MCTTLRDVRCPGRPDALGRASRALRVRVAAWTTAVAGALTLACPLPRLPRALNAQAAPATPAAPAAPTVSVGRAVTLGMVPSRFVAPRRVDVWLPPGYDRPGAPPHDVLYMHDGQNLLDPALAFGGAEWQIDEILGALVAQRRVRPTIVVAIWNTPQRFLEYMPQAAVVADTFDAQVGGLRLARTALRSDAYLRFLVEELKPAIDRQFRTARGREATAVMGSSMGGLISCYAMARYPDVFGAAGCVSTHWPAGNGAAVSWLGAHLPAPATHRLWFDHGTATLDSLYAPYQARMDTLMAAGGYVRGRNWMSRVYPGAEHTERAWAARVADPLQFLLRR